MSDIIDHVPWNNLFFILIAMPLVAVLVGWVLAGAGPDGDRAPGRWSSQDSRRHRRSGRV